MVIHQNMPQVTRFRRSQWPRGVRCGSAAASLLGLRVRIPPRTWMSVSYECCVCCQVKVSVSGWSLVQMSPVECGVYEFDCEASTMRRSWPTTGCLAKGRKKSQCFCEVHLSMCNLKYYSWKRYEGNRLWSRALSYLTQDRVKPRALVNGNETYCHYCGNVGFGRRILRRGVWYCVQLTVVPCGVNGFL